MKWRRCLNAEASLQLRFDHDYFALDMLSCATEIRHERGGAHVFPVPATVGALMCRTRIPVS